MTLDETRKLASVLPSLAAGVDEATQMAKQILQLMSSLSESAMKVDIITQAVQRLELMATG